MASGGPVAADRARLCRRIAADHLDSLRDVAEKITGAPPGQTVPDAVVRAADEIQIVDTAPEALRDRMAHGDIYPAGQAQAALAGWFRIRNLSALRELSYDGHPLYTYIGDTAPGQARGNNLNLNGGLWHEVPAAR